MNLFPPTFILRHRKENLKKCSLRGLENRADLRFFTYPWREQKPSLDHYVVLSFEGPLLSKADQKKGLFLIDGTWKYAQKMEKSLHFPFETRSLPDSIQSAYLRRQEDCLYPDRGLASVEALFVAYRILERDGAHLLDYYPFREKFLENFS